MRSYIKSECKYFTAEKIESLLEIFVSEHPIRIRSLYVNTYSITGMIELNTFTLGHRYVTDIITFCDIKKNSLDIQLNICLEYIDEYYEGKNVNIEYEYVRTFFHGLLHCIGLNDSNLEEKSQMRVKEKELCDKYFMFHVKPNKDDK